VKKMLIVLVVGGLIYLGYVFVTDPVVGEHTDCETWLRASEDHQLSGIDEWLQYDAPPEAKSSVRWQKVYAAYVTTACEGRHNDPDSAPDNVGENLDDAVDVTHP
jgi:hypothetical protein